MKSFGIADLTMLSFNCFFFFCFFFFFINETNAEKITNLPGLTVALNYSQYSGYITVDPSHGRQLHYWFIESESDPSTDPVVLWLTGGPGCSSIFALFTENGPFRIQPNFELKLNPYSWNRIANVIWLESPVGVGYSYSDTPSDYTTDDEKTAADSYTFLLEFFNQFPQFRDNDFFVAGESYAGHYVPQLAQKIMEGNSAGTKGHINLKGTMSGNPSTNSFFDGNSYIPFLAQHALAGLKDFEAAEKYCGGDYVNNNSAQCKESKQNIFERMSQRINPYNIYAKCDGKGPEQPGYCFTQSLLLNAQPTSQTFIPCINTTLSSVYMNRPDVRKALFVSDKVKEWTVCSQILHYSSHDHNMIPIYEQLVKLYRVVLYSGDVDSCVNYIGTQRCAENIQASGKKQDWTVWMLGDQVAGYKLILGDRLQYVTIKNAGHMVPMYQPEAALAFFDRFIHDKPI